MCIKDRIKESLKTGETAVTFTKMDGTVRRMVCTLDPKLIPVENKPKKQSLNTSEDVQTVYDLERESWRSFYHENVIRYETD